MTGWGLVPLFSRPISDSTAYSTLQKGLLWISELPGILLFLAWKIRSLGPEKLFQGHRLERLLHFPMSCFRIPALYCSDSANLEFSGSLKFPNNNTFALSLDQPPEVQPMGSGDFSLKKKQIHGPQLHNFNATVEDTRFFFITFNICSF